LQLGLFIEGFKIIIQVELGDGTVSIRQMVRDRISLSYGFLLTWYMARASFVDKRERILVNDQSACLLGRPALLLIPD
jgi:hypothetical protein